MSKLRLGKLERSIKLEYHARKKAKRQAIIEENLSTAKPKQSFAPNRMKALSFESRMTHGLYRGQYDPGYSTDRNTDRGLKLPKNLKPRQFVK